MRIMLIGILWAVASVAGAQNPHAMLDRYLTDDVVAVAYLDLSAVDIPAVLQWGEELGVLTNKKKKEMAGAVQAAQGWKKQLLALGAEHGYALFRVSDVGHRGPSWVVPVTQRGKIPPLPGHWEIVDGVLLGGTAAAQLKQLKNSRPSQSPRDLSDAWTALGQGHCGLLLFGDKDSRRVVREMFPQLPAPFQAIDGPWIADRLLWGGVVANLPPKPSVQIIIQADKNSTAKVLQESIASGFALFQQLPQAQKNLGTEGLVALADSLTPQIAEERLTISFENILNDFDRLARLLTPEVKAARQMNQRHKRMNDFKQIALGILNFESANGEIPPHSTYSDDGKPLLSWRVQILPYLGQGNLYKQFHLDEPWNSKHNLALVAKMPGVYADPNSALRKVNAQGKTTYVVPAGEGTVFDRPVGTKFKEITDGTSNTIMLVEVVPERAVVWTKPEDWQVDLENPWEGVRRTDRDWFTTGFCDGHAQIFDSSLPAKKLRALLTRDGGEVIEWP